MSYVLRLPLLVCALHVGCASLTQSSADRADSALRMAVRVESLIDDLPWHELQGRDLGSYYTIFQTRDDSLISHRFNKIPSDFSEILVVELRQSVYFEWVDREDNADESQYDLLLVWTFASIGGDWPVGGEATAYPLLNGEFEIIRTSDRRPLYKGGDMRTHHFVRSPLTFIEHNGKADMLLERGARRTRSLVEGAIGLLQTQ